MRFLICIFFTHFRNVILPSKRAQKRKGIDLLSYCPQPPKLTTRAIMEAHAPAIDGGMSARLRKAHASCPTRAPVSADADTLRLERENSSLLDEQVALVRGCHLIAS